MVDKNELFPFFSEEDAQKKRSVADFTTWVDSLEDEFGRTEERKKATRLRKGSAKVFFSEIRPLSLFVRYLANNGIGPAWVKPVIGNQAFDAELGLDLEENVIVQKIEFVEAIDGYDENLRMEVFNRDGHVSATGRVVNRGSKRRGRTDLKVTSETTRQSDHVNNVLNLITSALVKKLQKRYELGMWLVVIFDDRLLRHRDDIDQDGFDDMVASHTETTVASFSRVIVIGQSGRVYADIDLLRRSSN